MSAPESNEPKIKINEIFYSIQGESSYVGWPTVFIRTSGCNLRCTYCDTTYAYYEGGKQTLSEIIAQTKKHPARHVCVTGGEPLAQPAVLELMKRLCDIGYLVSLETSGSYSCEHVDPRVKKIIDVKTPDSGAADTFLAENLNFATSHDEFKFVICSERDFDWAEDFVTRHKMNERFLILYSPSFGKIEEKWLANKILSKSSKARLQLQLHKYIWSPDTRGV
ncbi:MAG TPA: radical SAM protein [Bdellovibrionales bacterium]|nr:radical SAM protein [Bdellovibrionales bacterium]